MIDELIDQIFALIIVPAGGPALASRMALTPPTERSHFISAPRSCLTRDDMARPDAAGLISELERLLDDLAPDTRAEALALMAALAEALAPTTDRPAEPSSLIYALH